jgi:hypothetical protein
MREARVVNDLAMTDVDSVVQVATSRRDEVRTQRRFLVTREELITAADTHGTSALGVV